MFIPTHRHKNGGLYQRLGTMEGKPEGPDVGWQPGVAYRNEAEEMFWTHRERWDEGFDTIEDSDTRDEIIWEDHVNVSAFRFSLVEATDVFYMISRAGPVTGHALSSEFISWMKRLFSVQAEMISDNLHIRDHDFPDMIGDVNAFHAKFGQEYTGKPRLLPDDLHDFRHKFHMEETHEYHDEYPKLLDAVARQDRRDIVNALETQLDSLVDAAWVILGTADVQFGRRAFIEAWRRVVKANMAKIRKDNTTDGDGSVDSGRAPKYDIVKPAGWEAPDHRDLVSDNAIFDELFGSADMKE